MPCRARSAPLPQFQLQKNLALQWQCDPGQKSRSAGCVCSIEAQRFVRALVGLVNLQRTIHQTAPCGLVRAEGRSRYCKSRPQKPELSGPASTKEMNLADEKKRRHRPTPN